MPPVPVRSFKQALSFSRFTPATFIAGRDYSAKSSTNSSGLARDPLRGYSLIGDDDGQFVHHVLGLADHAPHRDAGRGQPFLGHALAGVAAPAFYECASRKDSAIDRLELILVQPRFACALD